MINPELPPRAIAYTSCGHDDVTCPWCKQPAHEATITLEALVGAVMHEALYGALRGPESYSDFPRMAADCPHCRRPFAVYLHGRRRGDTDVVLAPMRTAADKRLLGEQP